MAVARGAVIPDCEATPAAIGTRATIVPTLVPMAMDMKQAATKSPARMSLPGRTMSVRFTVASMEPIALAVLAKAPAMAKIQIISITLGAPAPFEKNADPFRNLALGYGYGVDRGYEEGRGDGNLVEVLCEKRGKEVDQKKNEQRAKRKPASPARGLPGRGFIHTINVHLSVRFAKLANYP